VPPSESAPEPAPAPAPAPRDAERRYALSQCMACGCCTEACPNYHDASAFVGPAALNQVVLMNLHPLGRAGQGARIAAAIAPGGLQCCGNAQACVEVCPEEIPLTESIAALNRQATGHVLHRWLGRGR